ncbi:MAG TPA: TIM barrel protein [Bryobacteraceae bacterium]|nr:TIM barrel protein [Bryobacteraceae bacterium]
MFTRRQFGATLALSALELKGSPLGLPMGCQTYPVRAQIEKDFAGTLKQLAAIGYKNIEMCSPRGYAKSGYGNLVNVKAGDLRKTIHEAGLDCESCHFHLNELRENLDETIGWARELGLKQMVCSTLAMPKTSTLADWVKTAEDLNRIGEKVAKAGMQQGFHNHAFEFEKLDGVLIYDKLMSTYDPKLVKMQFQVSVITLGFQAADFFAKYPGRFCSIHLQDVSADKKEVPVGQGIVDWKKTFAAAKAAGVKNYFVEMNMDALKGSVPYLRDLKV